MSNIIPFQFEKHSIRVVTDESGEPLFVGKDICEALGYKDPTTAIRNHCKGVQKQHPLQTPGGMQELRVLTEPDVLRLIVNSTLPAAEPFERWVFEEVLPAIRKNGHYAMAGAEFKLPAPMVSAAVQMLKEALPDMVHAILAQRQTSIRYGWTAGQVSAPAPIWCESDDLKLAPRNPPQES